MESSSSPGPLKKGEEVLVDGLIAGTVEMIEPERVLVWLLEDKARWYPYGRIFRQPSLLSTEQGS